jgi:hypothetical protein
MDSAKSAVIYYSAAFISGLALASFLIHIFQWPVTASLVFGVSLFIQYMYLARKTFQYYKRVKERESGISQILQMESLWPTFNNKMDSEI